MNKVYIMMSLFLFLILAIVSGCGVQKRGGHSGSENTSAEAGSAGPSVKDNDTGIRSTFKQTTSWDKGEIFLNVKDSTDDPKIDHQTWIALYKGKCGINPGRQSASGLFCPQSAIGGHVVKLGQSQHPEKGSTVYIIPICTSENNKPDIQMTVAQNQTCVVELNYLMRN